MGRIRWPKVTRDTVLFVSGLLLTANEAILQKADRPTLLMLFAGMMGLPVFLNKDEKNGQKSGQQSSLIVTDLKDLEKRRGDSTS